MPADMAFNLSWVNDNGNYDDDDDYGGGRRNKIRGLNFISPLGIDDLPRMYLSSFIRDCFVLQLQELIFDVSE